MRLEEAADFTTCEADILQAPYSLPIEETVPFDETPKILPHHMIGGELRGIETGVHRLSLAQAFRHLEPKQNPNREKIGRQLTLQKITYRNNFVWLPPVF